MITGRKPVSVDFSDMSGGTNTADPGLSLPKNQVLDSLNAIFTKQNGFIRAPGFRGMASTIMHGSYYGRGIHLHESTAGVQTLLSACADGTVNSVNADTGALTTLHTPTGTGEAWFANAYGKTFIANGTAMTKVESSTVGYRVGIAAPTGVAAAKAAGGSLAAGAYKVYAVYGRAVGGTNVLYSTGQYIGEVTLETTNLTVAITNFADSADTQVNVKSIWMTDAAGTVIYYYGQTAAYADTTLNITSSANKNSALVYNVECANNQLPGAFTSLVYHAGRLWGVVANYLYFSLRAGNEYDLERWPSANYNEMPHQIVGMFVLGDHLYLSTIGGILRQPYGDPSASYEVCDTRWYYKYPRTVDAWGGQAIGLTNNGVRIFDGQKFSTIDLSRHMKPNSDDAYSNATTALKPCGKVIKRSIRTEYQLSYIDETVLTTMNNRTLVLDLDGVMIADEKNFRAPWEIWENGFAYCVQDATGVVYKGQAINDGSNGKGHIYKEVSTYADDDDLIDVDGTFLTTATAKRVYVKTRWEMPDINGNCVWQWMNMLYQINTDMTVTITIPEQAWNYESRTASKEAISGTAPLVDVALVDEAVLLTAGEYVISKRVTIGKKMKGKAIYLEFEQTADDITFKLLACVVNGILRRTRYT